MPQMCFSYPAPLPPGTGNAPVPSGPRRMPVVPCFNYPADGPRIMPAGACFDYLADGPRTMPVPCFSYSVHVPPGIGSDIAEPGLGEPRRMPHTCFRY